MCEIMCVKDVKQYALSVEGGLIKLVEGSTFPAIGLKSLSCMPRCRLVYCLGKAEFGGGIVDGRLWEK